MHTRPDWVRQPREVAAKALRNEFLKRTDSPRPPAGVWIAVRAESGSKSKQPPPAIRTLKRLPSRGLKISQFRGNVVFGQASIKGRADARGGRERREAPEDARQRPMAMHRGMPVKTTKECRVQLARRTHVRRAPRQVLVGVGPLAPDSGQRQAGKSRREGWGEQSRQAVRNGRRKTP